MYPVFMIQDRYCGVYSGGLWVAVLGDEHFERVLDVVHGDDMAASTFVDIEFHSYVATGNTPSEALENLRKKQTSSHKDEHPKRFHLPLAGFCIVCPECLKDGQTSPGFLSMEVERAPDEVEWANAVEIKRTSCSSGRHEFELFLHPVLAKERE